MALAAECHLEVHVAGVGLHLVTLLLGGAAEQVESCARGQQALALLPEGGGGGAAGDRGGWLRQCWVS